MFFISIIYEKASKFSLGITRVRLPFKKYVKVLNSPIKCCLISKFNFFPFTIYMARYFYLDFIVMLIFFFYIINSKIHFLRKMKKTENLIDSFSYCYRSGRALIWF